MGDKPLLPEPEPTRAEVARRRVRDAAQAAVPGVPLRRAILFLAIGVALALNLPWLGIPALLALALTDQVVAL
jgi:hypothetical protein